MSLIFYKLHTYVCGLTCTKAPSFDGWADFGTLYRRRPMDCRYGVAEHPPGNYLVWDFFDSDLLQRAGSGLNPLAPPPPIYAGTNLDGIIMKTAALYGQPD